MWSAALLLTKQQVNGVIAHSQSGSKFTCTQARVWAGHGTLSKYFLYIV